MTIVFDGIAFGMLLFLISVGLSVSLGLMNFVNLSHGAFVMLGGYLLFVMANKYGVPFPLCLVLVVLISALVGVVLERLLYRRLYDSSHLDQVLATVGVIFMSIAGAFYFFGAGDISVNLPDYLQGQVNVGSTQFGAYRIFIVALAVVIGISLQLLVTRTRFGAQLRAAVDNRATARALGVNVDRVFSIAFALGSGLAGLGGALGIPMLGLNPEIPLTYVVYFLIVAVVGGSSIRGAITASLMLGLADVLGKYYIPEVGAFMIYGVMVILLVARPKGLFSQVSV